ncbi:hypothetical protein NECAME_19330 [Necator americanus]|uniref:Trypsin Inhibitor like cysteine rich domain protein n=1 Tax=Necator americanus TaxID=51031 RepID=W2SPK6_NECAM|nr:hypothetical protein NECAME_19330 [Necator americanus]ETN71458.1 hypothetical protein NECAME_19330 [Necator americanus]
MYIFTIASLFYLISQSSTIIHPWYLPQEITRNSVSEENFVTTSHFCAQECMTTMDCDIGLSCFHATSDSRGCCLMALKPNETGCVLDDQCRRACESTMCEKNEKGSRCMCEKGRHFLFDKCWKKCPAFAFPEPYVNEMGFSSLQLYSENGSDDGEELHASIPTAA